MTTTFFKSTRGFPKLAHLGYVYTGDHRSKDRDRMTWRCDKSLAGSSCRGRATSENGLVQCTNDHDHEPDEKQISALVFKAQLNAAALQSQETPSVLVAQFWAKCDPAVRKLLPKPISLCHMINRHRRKRGSQVRISEVHSDEYNEVDEEDRSRTETYEENDLEFGNDGEQMQAGSSSNTLMGLLQQKNQHNRDGVFYSSGGGEGNYTGQLIRSSIIKDEISEDPLDFVDQRQPRYEVIVHRSCSQSSPSNTSNSIGPEPNRPLKRRKRETQDQIDASSSSPPDEWSAYGKAFERRLRRIAEQNLGEANRARRRVDEMLDEVVERVMGKESA